MFTEYPLSILIGFYYTAFGLIIGSFLNVCIYRIPLKISIAKGSSFCTSCKHNLGPLDLFPLFSYLFLGGKCRYCKSKISFRYPFVEALTGLCYLLSFIFFGFSVDSVILCAFFSVMIVISFIDYDTQTVLDRFHIIIFALGILSFAVSKIIGYDSFLGIALVDRIIGFFAVSVPLIIIVYIYYLSGKDGMGGADIKLFAVCGFFIGWKLILFSLLISSIIGAIYGIYVMSKQNNNEDTENLESDDSNEEENDTSPRFAFVPCIAIGTLVAIFFGNSLINWYLSLI